MDIEYITKAQRNQHQLPYQPITFVYTQTIGSVLQKFKEIVDPYVWAYEDILEPKPKQNNDFTYYYLFHIAPIYNWLRKLQSQILKKYLFQDSKPIFNPKVNLKNQNIQKGMFEKQIQHYVAQWQIVKLCTSAKIRIMGSKIKSSAQLSRYVENKMEKVQTLCKHMIKKQKFTTNYVLNNQKPDNFSLECSKVFCSQCEQEIQVRSQIVKYPFAPYFQKYYGKQFTITDKSSKHQYQLVLVYAPQKIYVKTSGGVWYQVSSQKTSIVSFQRIQIKTGLVFVYQQTVNSSKMLRKAETFGAKDTTGLITKSKTNKKQTIKKQTEKIQSEQSQEQYDLIKPKKTQIKPIQKAVLKVQKTEQANQTGGENLTQNQDEDPLQDMAKNPLPIVMNKKKTDRKLFKQYKKTVQSFLPKPKQKDEYEKNYDKGKTKKIHKNRQQFRTANFFNLYKQLQKNKPKVTEHSGEFQDKQDKKKKKQQDSQDSQEIASQRKVGLNKDRNQRKSGPKHNSSGRKEFKGNKPHGHFKKFDKRKK